MLYETLLQGKMFLCLLYFGILCGIFLSIKKLIDKTLKNNKVIVIVTDIIFMLFASIIFVFAKIKYCYGQFRIFELLSFSLGIYLQQISINNLVEKILNMSYTLFIRVFCKLKKTKIFSKIFKWYG